MTTSEPAPTAYPSSWWKPGMPPLEPEPEPESVLRPLEMELHAAAMSEQEWEQFVKRSRGDR